MYFAGVRELRLNTKNLLEKVDKGENILITYHGKPRAIIHGITEEEIEDYILMNHPEFKEKTEKAYKESLKGKITSLSDLIAETKKELA